MSVTDNVMNVFLSCRYHPFYITDSSEGGYGQLTDAQRRRETTFAGVEFDKDDYPIPTAGEYIECILGC